MSEECDSYGKGLEISPGEFVQIEDGEEVSYSHYNENELKRYLDGFEILYIEKRVITRNIDDEKYTSGYWDYILRKQ